MRGKGRVFPRQFKTCTKWYIGYCAPDPEKGRVVERRECAGETEEEARQLLEERLHEVRNHEKGIKRFEGPSRVTFRELAKDLETDFAIRGLRSARTTSIHLSKLTAYFGGYRAVKIGAAAVQRYVLKRQKEKAAPATIDRETELLRRAFKLGNANEKISFAPRVPRLLKLHQNARRGFLDRSAFEAILGAIPNTDFRDYLEWFWWTGMRPGEIASLDWQSFDRETWTLRLHPADAKIGQGRVVPVKGPLMAIIKRRMQARRLDCPLIFHYGGRTFGVEKGGLPERFYDMWFKAVKAAGLPGRDAPKGQRLTPYDLRRTAARNLRAAGIPERVAMEITGHKTRSMFDRYGIVDERDMSSALEAVEKYVAKLPAGENKTVEFPSSPASSPAKE